ncbi:MAG: dihydrolipoamide acetyltransferase, partial [Chloroflexi bacterium]
MPDVNMPKLSDTMEEGTIVEWKKSSGDEVHRGEVLAEVESDKATFDLEAEDDGKLEILVEKGVPAKIGAPIARIGAGTETQQQEKPAPKPKTEKKAEPKAEPKAETKSESAEEPAGKEAPEQPPPASPTPEPKKAAPAAAERPRAADSDGQGAREIRASPLARRLAEEMGVDLGAVTGTGPEGRVVKEDVIAAAGSARKDRRRP